MGALPGMVLMAAADEIVVLPDLDAVRVPEFVKSEIEIADALVDPRVPAVRSSCCTGIDIELGSIRVFGLGS